MNIYAHVHRFLSARKACLRGTADADHSASVESMTLFALPLEFQGSRCPPRMTPHDTHNHGRSSLRITGK